MNEFLILILWLAFSKLCDTLFNLYQVAVQYGVEKERIINEQKQEENVEERQIGFNAYGNTMTQVEEEDY